MAISWQCAGKEMAHGFREGKQNELREIKNYWVQRVEKAPDLCRTPENYAVMGFGILSTDFYRISTGFLRSLRCLYELCFYVFAIGFYGEKTGLLMYSF